MLLDEAQRILDLVRSGRPREALGVSPGALPAEINRAHLRLVARFRTHPKVVEALNGAKVALRQMVRSGAGDAGATAVVEPRRAARVPAEPVRASSTADAPPKRAARTRLLYALAIVVALVLVVVVVYYGTIRARGLGNLVWVGAGDYHTVALLGDGTVWAWGWNEFGQLGDGTGTDRSTPVQVRGLADVTAVAAGGEHSIALRRDGTVWAWGCNDTGQLGDGTETDRALPVQAQGLTDAGR